MRLGEVPGPGAPIALGSVGLLPRRRRRRLLALLAVRDESRYLPGYLANVGPQVDGIIALDDRSRDGSGELLEADPRVVELIRSGGEGEKWDEVGNYSRLVTAALDHDPDWLVSLDADERVERGFRRRAERVIERGERLGLGAFSVHLLELWASPRRYRVDGLWGGKRPARLFRAREDHEFDMRPLHAQKAPLQGRVRDGFPHADLRVYHLRMVHPEDREARRERYERADPDERLQPKIGYAYLTDETGLRLRRVPWLRGYRNEPFAVPRARPAT
jgi:hypothetical protein